MKKEKGLNAFLLVFISLAVFMIFIFAGSQTFVSGEVSNNTTTEIQEHSWIKGTQINDVAYDSANNLIYFVGNSGVFGTYNVTTNVIEDLRETDIGNWIGTKNIAGLAVDTIHNTVYLRSGSGTALFGVYNRTSNITENLNDTDPGNWYGTMQVDKFALDAAGNAIYFFGLTSIYHFAIYNRTANLTENLNTTGSGILTNAIYDIAFDAVQNLTYLASGNGNLRVYNRTENFTESLNLTDVGGWLTSDIRTLSLDAENNLIYFAGTALFGVYNRTSNITENLNVTGSVIPLSTDSVFDSTNNLFYFGGLYGQFGVYNRTSNLTENLNNTDSGDWLNAGGDLNLILDSNNGLVYLWTSSSADKFGVYNRTSNLTENLNDTDPNDWLGRLDINSAAFGASTDLFYFVGDSGVFGSYNKSSNVTEDLNLPNDWVRFHQLNSVILNPATSLIYFGGAEGVFGYYDRDLDEKISLKNTDSGDSMGFKSMAEMALDSDKNLMYIASTDSPGLYLYNISSNSTIDIGGWLNPVISEIAPRAITYDSASKLTYLDSYIYNISSNVSESLADTDDTQGNWLSSTTILELVYDSNNSLLYIGGSSLFGYYNRTVNLSYPLNGTDVDNWMGSGYSTYAMVKSSRDDLVYLAGSGSSIGMFGVYNRTENKTYNLNSTDPGNWMGSNSLSSLAYDSDADLVYLGGANGLFGAYNVTTNITEDLGATDTGDWVNTSHINELVYDSNNKLLYFVGLNGVFGYYNRTSNTTTEAAPAAASSEITSSGGSSAVSTKATQTISIGSVGSGGSASAVITNPKIDLRNITIFPKEDIENASLTVEQNPPTQELVNFAIPFGTFYQAFSITAKAIENENLNNVTLEFRVNKTWLAEQNYSYDNVALYRVENETSPWQVLPTVSIQEDAVYYYFSAISPGFSTFVIVANVKALECMPSQIRCFNEQVQLCIGNSTWIITETCAEACQNGKCVSRNAVVNFFSSLGSSVFFYMFVIFASSGVIVVAYLLFIRLRRESNPIK